MAVLREQLPHLSHFLDAYMHQDWKLFGDTVEAVIEVYAEDSSGDDVRVLRQEVDFFLSVYAGHVDPIYKELYPNSIQPANLGMTAETWLRVVAQLAARHTSEAPASAET